MSWKRRGLRVATRDRAKRRRERNEEETRKEEREAHTRERKIRVERGSKESTETAWEREKRSRWGWGGKAIERGCWRVRGGGERGLEGGGHRTETEDGGFVCRAQLRRAPCDERYTTRVRSWCLLEKERDHSLLSFVIASPHFFATVRITHGAADARKKIRKKNSEER